MTGVRPQGRLSRLFRRTQQQGLIELSRPGGAATPVGSVEPASEPAETTQPQPQPVPEQARDARPHPPWEPAQESSGASAAPRWEPEPEVLWETPAPQPAPEPDPDPDPDPDMQWRPEPQAVVPERESDPAWDPEPEPDLEPEALWDPPTEPDPEPEAASQPEPLVGAEPTPPEPVHPLEVSLSRQADLEHVLRELQVDVVDIAGVVVASRDGLPIASTANGPATNRVAAMAAAVLALAEQATDSTADTPFGHALIRGSDGCLAVYSAGDAGALAVQTIANPNVGLIQVEAPRAASAVGELLAAPPIPGAVPA